MSALAGTGRLLAPQLRAAWRGLTFWLLAAAGAVVVTAWSITALYPGQEQREAYAAVAAASPTMDIFNGRGYDLTLMGGIASYEVGFMGLVLFPVVALHLAIRSTRRDEDAGRTDLVTAAPVGRSAPLCAAAAAIALWLTAVVAAGALGLQAVVLASFLV